MDNVSLRDLYNITYLEGFISTYSVRQGLKDSYEKHKQATNDICLLISPARFLTDVCQPWGGIPLTFDDSKPSMVNNIINLINHLKDSLPRESTVHCFLFTNKLFPINLHQSNSEIKKDITSKIANQPQCDFKAAFSQLFNEVCHIKDTKEVKKFLRVILFTKSCDKSPQASEIKDIMSVYTSSKLDFEGITSNYIFCENENDFSKKTMKEADFLSLTDNKNINGISNQVGFLTRVYTSEEKKFIDLDENITAFALSVLQEKFVHFANALDEKMLPLKALHLAIEKELMIIQNPKTSREQKQTIIDKINDHVMTTKIITKICDEIKQFYTQRMSDEYDNLMKKISGECDVYRREISDMNNTININQMKCSYWEAKVDHLNNPLNEIEKSIQRFENFHLLIDEFMNKINGNALLIINCFSNSGRR